MSISRRSILKGGLFASAALPFLNARAIADDWFEQQAAVPDDISPEKPIVKLNSNENPYGPCDAARQAIIDAIKLGNRYPRPSIKKLKKQIAEREQISADQVVITAGSTELLGVFGLMAGMTKGNVIGCSPSFDFMLYFAEKFGAEYVKVPLTDDHRYNLPGIDDKINDRTNLIFICNPNNPTGTELDVAELQLFCQQASERCMVYVDEAYIEFSKHGLDASLANMTRNNRNLVVGRTFSKIYGLAGLRVGYAIGHAETIRDIEAMLQGRTITASATSLAAASASLADEEFVRSCREKTNAAKEIVYSALDGLDVEYIPSSTSFVFFRTENFGETNVRKELQRKNILIRDYKHVPGWARVSIGTEEEMQTFCKAVKKLV